MMTAQPTKLPENTIPQRSALGKLFLYSKKTAQGVSLVSEGFLMIFRYGLYKAPNHPDNTRYVQYFCRRLGEVFNVTVEVHGHIPRYPALWVSNHISWLDVAVLGTGARVFFLAKAEVQSWPVLGKLAAWGGTLFIRRGSGDSVKIREQIANFLRQDIPVLFFPEATTGDGRRVKKVHPKLLGAAIEANKPVQICLICYINAENCLDTVVPFVGEQTFLDNIAKILQMDRVVAHLVALPAIDSTGHTLESLGEEVQQRMIEGLAALHQKILTCEV